jgi:single-strand DNA-binding protein
MNNLNSIIIEGNLTKDPEYHTTPKGTPVCTFSVASNRFFKQDDEQKKEVSFFPVETWARNAELCNEYLNKGRGVRVVGRLKQDRWKAQDGSNRERVKIVAEHVEFKPLFSRAGSDDDDAAGDEKKGEEELDIAAVNTQKAEGSPAAERKTAQIAAEKESELAVPPKKKKKNEDDQEDLLEAV